MKRSLQLLFFFLLLGILNLKAQTVTFSQTRGFYTSQILLTLTTDVPGATIRYTLNGTPPTDSTGTIYTSATRIKISTSTVVRAIAIQGIAVSKVFTHTYIFPDKVILQTASISGWPRKQYELGSGNAKAIHDYEMDPDVVNNPAYSGQMIDALKAIPTMSIAIDKNAFWLVNNDVTTDLEQPVSVELIYPNAPAQNEQFNCGLEAHSHLRLKRSFKLDLHSPEFISKIFKYAPLNSATATDNFSGNKIVLRGGNNDCWARNWNPSGTTYTRDEWYRSSQAAVDGYASHGTFVHLYINGLYWGLYNPVERPDEGFASEYLGGSTADWFSVNHDGLRKGDSTRYNYLIGGLTDKAMNVPANYSELQQYLNVSEFADYMIITWMPGVGDWPGNNYYGGNRNTPVPQPHQYFAWDGEWSWVNKNGANNGAWVSTPFKNAPSPGGLIPKIWHSARQNPDFMMMFADRVYKNCFNGGPMTDSASIARWDVINNFISTAIIAESARWGDAVDPLLRPRTKNEDWQPEVNRIRAQMNGNVARFITALRAEGYYPSINPPAFNSEGGTVLSNFQLVMTNPNGAGTIYYTIDGSDPRLSGGGLAAGAIAYSSPVVINGTVPAKARVKNGNEWSALHEAVYTNAPDITGLFINEFLASNQTDIVDEFGQHDDWFEIYNDNTYPVNIGGLFVTDNLANLTKFQIPATNPAITTIPAKGFLLLWADDEAAQGPLHVGFKLGNGGEQLGLVQQSAAIIRVIDSLSFGIQTNNISRGRLPNGGNSFVNFTTTTPGASNVAMGNTVDCNGVTDGTATLDDCGICSGGNTGHVANSNKDCNGVCNGTATLDGCGICSGGNTGHIANSNKDCNGVCNGTATLDGCGICSGGNTGHIANADKDACGICFGNGSSCAPTTCVHNEVVSFTLMKTGTAGEIGALTNGMTINLAVTPQFSVRANVCDSPVGSVKFKLDGTNIRTETAFPYAVNGDSPVGSYIAWSPGLGTHTLVCTPYTGASGSGTAGISKTVVFTIVNQSGTPDCNGVSGGTAATDDCGVCAGGNTGRIPNANKDCYGVCFGTATIDGCGICSGGNTGKIPNADKDACGVCFGNGSSCAPASCVHNEVISFTLMKAGTAGEIGPLTNGMIINKATTGSFSIRANVCDSPVGSVKFIVNGSTIRTETSFPYAINGDSPVGSYTAWNPAPGSYTLEGKPYSGAGATGTAGISEIVTFTVVNAAAKMGEEEFDSKESVVFNIYPNPNNGNFRIEAYNETVADFSLRVYNALGQVIFLSKEKEISGEYTKPIRMEQATSGIYYIEMMWGSQVRREKVIVN